MKNRAVTTVISAVLLIRTLACAETAPEADPVRTAKLTAHCASVKEKLELMCRVRKRQMGPCQSRKNDVL